MGEEERGKRKGEIQEFKSSGRSFTHTHVYTFRILSFFNTHTRREKKILKKLIVVYIQKGLILG